MKLRDRNLDHSKLICGRTSAALLIFDVSKNSLWIHGKAVFLPGSLALHLAVREPKRQSRCVSPTPCFEIEPAFQFPMR